MPTVRSTPEQDLTTLVTSIALRMDACKARVRLELLGLLLAGPADVTTLTRRLDLDLPTVSRNLAGMRKEGILVCERQYNRKIHSLSRVVQVQRRDGFAEMWIGAKSEGQFILPIPEPLADRLEKSRADLPERPTVRVTVKQIDDLQQARVRRTPPRSRDE